MAERKWTADQQDAIRARRGTLLVSAAAGSGKTAVLVQRVMDKITEDGCDADRLLVVTFTKAAAAEMKQRIAESIAQKLSETPENHRLHRQRLMLERAHISTVHSFCAELVREHFHALNISPTFRIATEDEMKVLKLAAAQEILDEAYEQQNAEGFRMLSDLFSGDRDDEGLNGILERLYDFIRAHAFPEQWLTKQQAAYENCTGIAETPWGGLLFAEAERILSRELSEARENEALAAETPEVSDTWGATLQNDREQLEYILSVARKKQWDTLREVLSHYELARWKSKKGLSDRPDVLLMKNRRDNAKKHIGDLQAMLDCPEAEATAELRAQIPMLRALFDCVRAFSDRLEEKKAERNVLDFGDLEHLALKLLYEEQNGEMVRTAIAAELSGQFDEVMVDEYQDTNEAQDRIFRAVSRNEENLFMVGDVKQSIYSFRQADPALFLARQKTQPIYDREREEYPSTVVLRKNFRSRRGITDGCNFLFRTLMTEKTCGVAYRDAEELIPGAEYPEHSGADMTFCVLTKPQKEEKPELTPEGVGDIRQEAQWIAGEIRRMMAEGVTVGQGDKVHPLSYRDCCILLRSVGDSAQTVVETLEESGIPAWASVRGGFFRTREVATVLAYLQIIDNPLQDIPMLTVLYSPIYGFSPDELARVRLSARNARLYDAVVACRKQWQDEKCARVLADLEKYRRLSATMDVEKLTRRIIAELRLEAILMAMHAGEQRVANLRLLMRYAQSYEAAGYSGLSGFLRYIERLKQSREDLSPASVISEKADVVKVMSIHHSKGLEFPVVFLADTARQFNVMSRRGAILLHPTYGAAMYAIGAEGIRYKTAAYHAVRLAITQNEIAEELRVLYVALTRAREKCFILYSTKEPEKKLSTLAAAAAASDLSAVVPDAASPGDWLLMAALRHPDARQLDFLQDVLPPALPAEEPMRFCLASSEELSAAPQAVREVFADAGALTDRLQMLRAYRYPLEALTVLPVKTAISAIAEEKEQQRYYGLSRPMFLQEKSLTAAERGTVMHKLIQFADFAAAERDLQSELERLEDEEKLTETEIAALDLPRAEAFFRSPLAERIRTAPRVWKEYRFMLEAPATVLDASLSGACAREQIVLQGVADCVLEMPEGLVLIDYKTDRVAEMQTLVERYAMQLKLYANALEQCFRKPVCEKLICSLHLGETVSCP